MSLCLVCFKILSWQTGCSIKKLTLIKLTAKMQLNANKPYPYGVVTIFITKDWTKLEYMSPKILLYLRNISTAVRKTGKFYKK